MGGGYYKAPGGAGGGFRGVDVPPRRPRFLRRGGPRPLKGPWRRPHPRRGENVSAMELEFVAMGHERVVEAAAYGVPGEFGEHEVKLDVVLQGDLELEELHAWLESKLPRYMVPRYLERLDEFPKTPSMKIEKYRLAERALNRPEVATFDARRR